MDELLEQQPHATEADFDRDFPILAHGLYANHAAMAPWPAATCQAVQDFASENAMRGPAAYRDWLSAETRLRKRIAGLLNAPDHGAVSLLENTTSGVNIVAGGMDWNGGDNIVTAVGEFITNQLAWEQLEAKGVEVRRVDIRAAENPEAVLLDHVDGRTRVLAISSVQWTDGFRLDLEALGQGLGGYEIVFFVDAIQHVGALPLDVTAARIDCLAAGSHKWQLGPEGIGLFYCRDAWRERFGLQRFGWRMLDDPYRFNRPDRKPARSGRRFEPGSPNTMGQVALHASLGVIEAYGIHQVGQWVIENTRALVTGLSAIRGIEVQGSTHEGRLSGIVSFAWRDGDVGVLYRALRELGISCKLHPDSIRLSPHFYQKGEPVARLVDAIERSVVSDKTD